jgi:NADPH:quinone reductase-like Zn-dependent oxidoreductase
MRAVQITEFGGPEVLKLVELDAPAAGGGQVLVEVTSAGVNYADTHHPVTNTYRGLGSNAVGETAVYPNFDRASFSSGLGSG